MQFIFSRFPQVSRWSFERATRWSFLSTLFLAAIIFIPIASVPFFPLKVFVLVLGSVVTVIFYTLDRLTSGNFVTPPLLLLGAIWLVPAAYGISVLFSSAPASRTIFVNFQSDTFGFMLLVSVLATLAALIVRRRDHYQSFFRVATWLFGTVFFGQLALFVIHYFYPTLINANLTLVGSFSDVTIFAGLGLVMMLIAFRFMVFSRRALYAMSVSGVLAIFVLGLGNNFVTWMLVGLVAFGLFVESVMRRSLSDMPSIEDDMSEMIADEVTTEMYVDTEDMSSVDDEQVSKSRVIAPLVVLVAAAFFIIGGATVANTFDSVVRVNTVTVRPSWQSTLSVGQKTYRSDALFGSGPNTFKQQLLLFRDAGVNLTPFWSTDFVAGIGFIPTSFVTTGIVGVLAWIVFLSLFLFFGIRSLIARKIEDSFIYSAAVLSFVGMIFVMVELVFNVPGPVIIVLGFVLAGIFASTLRSIEPQGQRLLSFSQNPRIGFVIAFSLTLLLLVSVMVAYRTTGSYLAQVSFISAENALASGNLVAATTAADTSLRYYPTSATYRLKAAIDITRINQIVQKSTTNKGKTNTRQLQALFANGIAVSQAAIKDDSKAYENWVMLGNVFSTAVPLGVSSAYDSAQKAYKKASTLNPTSPLITFTLARLALTKKDYKGAESFLAQTVKLKRNYTPAILELAQVDALLGKAKDALRAAETAAYFIPNNPVILFRVGVLRLETNDNAGAVQALSQAVLLNPNYANARYFLAIAYAQKKSYTKAVGEIKAISALSSVNAKAVAHVLSVLKQNKNPFAQNTVGTPIPSSLQKK